MQRSGVNVSHLQGRRLFQDGTSSLAAALIEKVPHKCKFSVYGCEVKDLLGPLKVHEVRCAERTIRCLLFECRDIIQVKKFEEHFKDHQSKNDKCCAELVGPSFIGNFHQDSCNGMVCQRIRVKNFLYPQKSVQLFTLYTGSITEHGCLILGLNKRGEINEFKDFSSLEYYYGS